MPVVTKNRFIIFILSLDELKFIYIVIHTSESIKQQDSAFLYPEFDQNFNQFT
jgi:hypothetical protein